MASIQLRTAIPGPRSQELMRRRNDAVPRGVYHSTPVFAARAEGALVEDVDGNTFIDLAGGIGCVNVGHRAEPVMAAIQAQTEKYLHTCFSVSPYEGYVRVAERLNQMTPGKFPKKTLLVNTGAEAVENAVKIARAYTGRPGVICFEDAFHGRTLLALGLTSKTNPYKAGFQPFPSDIYRIPYAYCYRCSYGLQYPSCEMACARHLERVFQNVVSADSVAAVIVEPVLGEGGFMAPPPEYFKVLADICRKHGIVFIADEVQTGISRTGTMFSIEQYGVDPDILITAKSLGGGLPIGAVTGRTEIMDTPVVGGLGGTFIGNPVSCAAALAVLDMIEELDLNGRAKHLEQKFLAHVSEWKERMPIIGAVHGLGAMRSLELVRDPLTKEPAREETKQIVRYCYEHGVLTISAGTSDNIVRILMPLVIIDEQFDEAMTVLQDAISTVSGRATTATSSNRGAYA
jgi:4-aminobutyrate aminotransferase / (S)-3-amino-2-methylpropionate transaminase / 5-aminovalerate transaminase